MAGPPGQMPGGRLRMSSCLARGWAITAMATSLDAMHLIAVGTRITARPPHRTVRAAFPHTAPTLGV